MKIYDQIEQGTAEWWEVRSGVPTASRMNCVLTSKTAKPSAPGMQTLMIDLITDVAARGAPEQVESFTSKAMQYGTDTEPEARKFYEMKRNCRIVEVGFIKDRRLQFGCSPDGLVKDAHGDIAGGLELKCPMLKTQVKYLDEGAGVLPTEYKQQVHSSLVITGLPWWDFLSYAVGLPPVYVRVFPDSYTMKMKEAMETFWCLWQAKKAKPEFAALFAA